MSLSRRRFITTASGAAAGTALPFMQAFAQGTPIKLGSVLDNSGNLDGYGKPMVQATTLAVEEINAAGGLLGRKIELVQLRHRSRTSQLYTKYAQQLARDDKVDVVHGGITSASREVIRPTFKRFNTLYFYNMLYEGGVCDRNIFVHRHDAGADGRADRRDRDEEVGQEDLRPRGRLQLRPDHRQVGRRTTSQQSGGSVAQDRLLPARRHRLRLDHREDPGRPSPTSSCRPWSAARTSRSTASGRPSGMNKKIPMGSTTFGVGNEHLAAVGGRGRRHPDRRQLLPGRRHAGQQGVPRDAGPSASATPRSSTRSPSRSTRASSCGPRR